MEPNGGEIIKIQMRNDVDLSYVWIGRINHSDPLVSKYRINDEDSNDGNCSGNVEEEIQLLGKVIHWVQLKKVSFLHFYGLNKC